MTNFLRGPVDGEIFEELLSSLVPLASTAGMTSTRSRSRGDFISAARDHLIGSKKVRRWPGVVSGGRVRLYEFRYDAAFAELMVARCASLYGFHDAGMPDNLHIVSSAGRVLLGSVTLDEAAWTDLSPTEWGSLVADNPGLSHLRMETLDTPGFDSLARD